MSENATMRRFVTLLFILHLLCTTDLELCYSLAAAEPNSADSRPASAAKEDDKAKHLFDGKTLAGWHIADTGDFRDHGKIEVVNGEIRIAQGDPASGISWKGPLPRMDYEIELSAKRTGGMDFFCGLTFPIGEEPCTWIVGGWGGGVIGLSNINGSSAVENETTTYKEFQQDRWYKLRLRVTQSAVQAWIDDEQVIDLDSSDKEFNVWLQQGPMKPLGIATWDTAAAIKDLRLKPIDVGETTKP